ncbi:MAG: hypothetical protein H6745_24425 [Deltaproteobacteria bacterium]|nr:hypothetical protein [Deltaproteobacteria bacterium]
MLRWLIKRKIAAFEADNHYDATYLHHVLDAAGPGALGRFARATKLGHWDGGLPRDALHAARVAAIVHEDCGPCTQLAVGFAAEAGVPDEIVRAVLRGDDAALPADAHLAVAFTRAAMRRAPEAAALRREVVARFGERGLVALAFTMTAAKLYPSLKYALGHGEACSLVKVGGTMTPVAHPAL